MPVDYDRAAAVAASVADVYRAAELRLIRLITDRLAAEADASDWATRKLLQLTGLRRAAQLVADQLQRTAEPRVRAAVADGYRSGNAAAAVDLAELLVGDVGPHARQAKALAGHAVQALADAAVVELRPVYAAILPQTEQVWRKTVAAAAARRLAGVQEMRYAAQAAWSALAEHGVVQFIDTAGRRWQLSTWVEMAVRTAVGRAAVAGQVDAWTAADITDCYVVDRPRECPWCAPWENKVLSLAAPVSEHAVATLAQAQAAGLHHPNCRHKLRPWRPGIRIGGSVDPEGPQGYAAEQRQRELERGLRGWRSRRAAAFTPEAIAQADAKIVAWQQALEDHLVAWPRLARLTYREFPGAGFVAPVHRRHDTAYLGG